MIFIKEIKIFLKSTTNLFSFSLALIPSLLLWLLRPDGTVNMWLFIVTLYICFMLLWLLILVLINSKNKSDTFNLSIINFTHNMFLCEATPFLAHDSIVSIYLKENGFENLIGYGIVVNIQNNGLIQIEPHQLSDTVLSNSSNFTDILMNTSNIIIKPTVNKKIINTLNT